MSLRGRRAGQYARSQSRQQYSAFVRSNLRLIAVMFASVYAVTFVVHRVWPREFNDVFVGAMLAVPPWIVSLLAVSRPATAAWARGADAEEWTGSALRRALPKGYRVLNDVQFAHSNVDHVIVGPIGVLVVETKWRTESWKSAAGGDVVRGACNQVRHNARQIARVLAQSGIEVTPQMLVVLWGGGSDRWSTRTIEHVPVVAGQHLRKWAASLDANGTVTAECDAIVEAIGAGAVSEPSE